MNHNRFSPRAVFLLTLIFTMLFVVPLVSASASFAQEPTPIEDVLAKLPPVSIGGIGLFGMIVSIVQAARSKLGMSVDYALLLAFVLVLVSYGLLAFVAITPAAKSFIVGGLKIVGTLLSFVGGPKLIYKGLRSAGVSGFAKA